MKYIDQIELDGKRVFIRADLNVPFDESGKISDDNRIRASLPTIELALSKGARIILASHLGSPKGKRVDKLSLKPVAVRIGELLKRPVTLSPEVVGTKVEAASNSLKPGEILVLENLRFHAEEEENDEGFAKGLAALCDVYINDAFATAHRKHASIVGLPKHVPVKAGGLTMKSELEYFSKAFEKPARPFTAIFGGAKVSTKMAAIRNVGRAADKILIGGAMANTFFAAAGFEVGKSLFEPEQVEAAKEAEKELKQAGCRVFLPVDVVCAKELKAGAKTFVTRVDTIPSDSMALDIGPQTVEVFRVALKDAGTIIWNGPMGAFETKEFSDGTYAIVDALTESQALTVVGGGDTDLALHEKHAFDKMSYVSTAGGAFLKLLEGAKLPGVAALDS